MGLKTIIDDHQKLSDEHAKGIEEDLLKFMIERAGKIDTLLHLYFDMYGLEKPSKESGELWIDEIRQESGLTIENYYYRDDLILTVENTATGYKITKKGFNHGNS